MSDQQSTSNGHAEGQSSTEQQSTARNESSKSTDSGGSAGNLPQTQEEFDRILESRLARERKKLGAENLEELRTKSAEYDKLKDSMLSEQEKAVKAAREEATNETAAKYRRQIVSSEVKASAAGLKFRDPGDALAHISVDDLIDGDGADPEKVTAALKDLASKKPYLIAADEPPTRNRARGIRRSEDSSGRSSNTKKSSAAEMLREYSRGS